MGRQGNGSSVLSRRVLYLWDELLEECGQGGLAGVDGLAAAGEDDLGVGQADKAEDLLEVAGFCVVGFAVRTRRVDAAGGDDDGRFLVLEQAFVAGGKGLVEADDVTIHALRMAGVEKLYMGVPMTMWSAALSSATSSSEMAMACFISGECCAVGV